MTRIRLSGRLICARADECAIIERYLPQHIALTRAEPGCLRFDVTRSDDPRVWLVEELFVDQAAFDVHQARVKASEWGEKTAGIRRDYEITAV